MRSVGKYRPRRSIALAIACLLGTTACRDSGTGDDDPTISVPEIVAPTETTVVTTATTATTALIPLDQDPPVVDLAYAQRVLDEINRLDHEASLILYREKRVTPEHEGIMTAIYFGEALADARTATAKDLSLGLSTWQDPPGPTKHIAKRLLSSRVDCVALMADSDARLRYKTSIPVTTDLGVVLKRNFDPTVDELRINPSRWMETLSATVLPGMDLGDVCR